MLDLIQSKEEENRVLKSMYIRTLVTRKIDIIIMTRERNSLGFKARELNTGINDEELVKRERERERER